MDDVWIRLALLGGALLLAIALSALLRRRRRRPVRSIETPQLSSGVYFFSSVTCPTCTRARTKLDARLGEGGYTEFKWESDSAVFTELDVDVVPAVAIVDEAGRGRLYAGQPERALARL